MSDWQKGDLALCVTKAVIHCPECGCTQTGRDAPERGTVSEVLAIARCDDDNWDGDDEVCATPVLFLASGRSGLALRFRKVTPDAADEFDRETIALMNGVRETARA